MPCIAHNHSYDLGLVLKEMQVNVNISVLVKQGLKYHSVSVGNLKFLDSMAFMNGSLSSLAKTHIESGLPLKYSKHLIQHLPPEAHSLLLTGKGSSRMQIWLLLSISIILLQEKHPRRRNTTTL